MEHARPMASILRAEARLLGLAGILLLAAALPFTLILVALALARDDVSPLLPLTGGAPPIMLGYLACHFASQRLLKAKALESLAASSHIG